VSRTPEALLPLKHLHYLILLALAGQDLHGYGLKKEIHRRTGGRVSPGAGSLYRSIRQLEDEGLIEESDWRPNPALDDERRRYFRVTEWGRDVARAETERLGALVASAREAGVGGKVP
jgi:DNA-binding PadR family transcriptional regulator